MKNQEDEFYGELDQKKLHRSCCTAQTMLLFFLVILVFAIVASIYTYSRLKKITFSSKTILSTFQNKSDFQDKLKLAPEQESFEIEITSEELTAITAQGISGRNFIIKNIQVMIMPEGMTVFGTLLKPLNSQIKIETVPQVENGKIKLEVKRFQAGSLALPGYFQNKIEAVLNQAMDQNFAQLYLQAEVQTISLFDDKMTISGKMKKN